MQVSASSVWPGDVDALNRIAPPVPDVIHTVIVSVNPDSRESWKATRGMTDEQLDAYDDQRIQVEDDRKPVPELTQEIHFEK